MGEGCTGPARCAHRMNGSQGGPPNGKCAPPPRLSARRETTRRLHRSRASGAPSAASSDTENAAHIPGPMLPTRTSVAAEAPSVNGGTASSAATWNAPRLASPSASTAATTASRDRAGDSPSRTEPFTPSLGGMNEAAKRRLGRTAHVPNPLRARVFPGSPAFPGSRASRPPGPEARNGRPAAGPDNSTGNDLPQPPVPDAASCPSQSPPLGARASRPLEHLWACGPLAGETPALPGRRPRSRGRPVQDHTRAQRLRRLEEFGRSLVPSWVLSHGQHATRRSGRPRSPCRRWRASPVARSRSRPEACTRPARRPRPHRRCRHRPSRSRTAGS